MTKETAHSLDLSFKYRKGDKNLFYVPEFDALIGNPIPPFTFLVKKAQEASIPLSDQEQYKIVHLKTWHEGMHGIIYRKIGKASAFRQIPEDYWLYKEEAKKFGRNEYDGLTLNLFLDSREIKLSTLEQISKEGKLSKRIASLAALLLFFHKKQKLREVKEFWGRIKSLCQSIGSIKEIDEVTPKIRDILISHCIKGGNF